MISLYQKYRPKRFSELVGQQEIAALLLNQVRKRRTSHSYLFAGPSGCGKTSTSRILAMALNCEHPRAGEPCLKCPHCLPALHGNSADTVELDTATFRGLDGIRELQQWSHFAPWGNYRVYLLEEVHQLTDQAWDALLRLLEEPTERLTTIMCTTKPEKVPETVKSRCQTLMFSALTDNAVAGKLDLICRKEHIAFANGTVKFLASMAQGNLRLAESRLEQVIAYGADKKPHQLRRFIERQLILT